MDMFLEIGSIWPIQYINEMKNNLVILDAWLKETTTKEYRLKVHRVRTSVNKLSFTE